MTVIGIDKIQALLRLSQIDELYLFDAYTTSEDSARKVILLGVDSDSVFIRIKELPDNFIIPISEFTGYRRRYLFMADDVWNEVFEDL